MRGPRLEVVAHHEPGAEACRFRPRAPVEELGGVELLEHRRVADLRHGPKRSSPRAVWSRAERAAPGFGAALKVGRRRGRLAAGRTAGAGDRTLRSIALVATGPVQEP